MLGPSYERLLREVSDHPDHLLALAIEARRRCEYQIWLEAFQSLWRRRLWSHVDQVLSGTPPDWVAKFYPATGTSKDAWTMATLCLQSLLGESWLGWLGRHSEAHLVAGIVSSKRHGMAWQPILDKALREGILCHNGESLELWVKIPIPDLPSHLICTSRAKNGYFDW